MVSGGSTAMDFDDVRGARDRTSNGGGGIVTRISSSIFIRRGFDQGSIWPREREGGVTHSGYCPGDLMPE